MKLVVNGLLTSYHTIGNGARVILCLHGWADNGKTFESLAKQFAPDYQIISPDLPGFGASEAPKTAWQLDDYAGFVSSFIDKLRITPYAVIAHSNGGAIAVVGLANKHFTSEKLILLASAGIRNPKSIRNKSLSLLAGPAKLILKATPGSTQKKIRQKFYSSIGSDYMIAEHMQETFRNIVATDVLDDARMLRLPTILIYGGEDTSTPIRYGKMFEEAIPESRLHVIESTGHHIHREQVYKVAGLIREFLK